MVRSDAADNYWKITGGPPGDGLGAVLDAYSARAGARSDDVQDGGVVTALLIAALAGGEIDGALVTRPSDDPDEPWKGVAHLATTAKEITEAAGSYYNQTMALAELDLSKYDLPAKPRIAVVGTPCEIQGIRAMQSRRWPTGAHRIDSVVLTIALLCTKSFDYQGLMLQLLRDDRGIDIERVSKVDVIRGRMIVEYRDGELAVDEPIKNFHGAALKGCDECADFLGRSADLSVGSVGAMDGWSSVLVRSERGRRALDNARGRLDLRELDNPGALVKLDSFDKRVAIDSLRRDVRSRRPAVHRLRRARQRLRGHRPGPGRARPLSRTDPSDGPDHGSPPAPTARHPVLGPTVNRADWAFRRLGPRSADQNLTSLTWGSLPTSTISDEGAGIWVGWLP